MCPSSKQVSLSPYLPTICSNMDHHAWTLYSFCCLVLHCTPALQLAYTWVNSYEPLVWVLCEYTCLFCFDVHPGVSPLVLWSLCLACWRIAQFFSIFHSSSNALSLVFLFYLFIFLGQETEVILLLSLRPGWRDGMCALPCVHCLCALPCLGTRGS